MKRTYPMLQPLQIVSNIKPTSINSLKSMLQTSICVDMITYFALIFLLDIRCSINFHIKMFKPAKEQLLLENNFYNFRVVLRSVSTGNYHKLFNSQILTRRQEEVLMNSHNKNYIIHISQCQWFQWFQDKLVELALGLVRVEQNRRSL